MYVYSFQRIDQHWKAYNKNNQPCPHHHLTITSPESSAMLWCLASPVNLQFLCGGTEVGPLAARCGEVMGRPVPRLRFTCPWLCLAVHGHSILLSQNIVGISFSLKILFIYFWREEKGERNTVCERNIERLHLTRPKLGTWPATQACALTGNWTSNLLVCGTMLTEPHQSGLVGISYMLLSPLLPNLFVNLYQFLSMVIYTCILLQKRITQCVPLFSTFLYKSSNVVT